MCLQEDATRGGTGVPRAPSEHFYEHVGPLCLAIKTDADPLGFMLLIKWVPFSSH